MKVVDSKRELGAFGRAAEYMYLLVVPEAVKA